MGTRVDLEVGEEGPQMGHAPSADSCHWLQVAQRKERFIPQRYVTNVFTYFLKACWKSMGEHIELFGAKLSNLAVL